MTYEPGLFPGIASEAYHYAPGLSSTGIAIFDGDSPAHYQKSLTTPFVETWPMTLGTLFHLRLLEPHRYGEGVSHWVRPEGKAGNFTTVEGKAWKVAHADKPCLTKVEAANMESAREAVFANPIARTMLERKGMFEASAWGVHKETGLLLKCRPDWLTEDDDGRPCDLNLKTNYDPTRFAYIAADLLYHVRAAHYEATLASLPDPLPGVICIFLIVALEPEYGINAVRLAMLDADTRAAAETRHAAALIRFAECTATGTWPLPPCGIEFIRVK